MRRPAPRGGARPDVPDKTGSPAVGSADYFHASDKPAYDELDPPEWVKQLVRTLTER